MAGGYTSPFYIPDISELLIFFIYWKLDLNMYLRCEFSSICYATQLHFPSLLVQSLCLAIMLILFRTTKTSTDWKGDLIIPS